MQDDMLWWMITDFGDSAAMLPAAFAVTGWLVLNRLWRPALVLAGLLVLATVAVAGSKIAYLGWGIGLEALNFTGISGHSTLSTLVLPVAGYFCGALASPRAAVIGAWAGLCAGLVVGFSRIVLGCHSASEVIAGCLLGGSAALVFLAVWQRRVAIQVPNAAYLAAGLLLIVGTAHGHRAPAEGLIGSIAMRLSGHPTVYVRPALHPMKLG